MDLLSQTKFTSINKHPFLHMLHLQQPSLKLEQLQEIMDKIFMLTVQSVLKMEITMEQV